MAQANKVIEKAKVQAGYHVIRKEEFIPTNRDTSVDQLYVSVSPVLSIEINKQRPRGKRV